MLVCMSAVCIMCIHLFVYIWGYASERGLTSKNWVFMFLQVLGSWEVWNSCSEVRYANFELLTSHMKVQSRTKWQTRNREIPSWFGSERGLSLASWVRRSAQSGARSGVTSQPLRASANHSAAGMTARVYSYVSTITRGFRRVMLAVHGQFWTFSLLLILGYWWIR